LVDWWSAQARKGARRKHALAVVDYALACGYLDRTSYEDFQVAVAQADHDGPPAVVADLPVPRWDTMPVTAPVDGPQREFAIALLDIAAEFGVLDGTHRRWRTIFAAQAQTAGDLLVLFLDLERHLRHRRNDPAMVTRLERLAFLSEIVQARGRGRLSRVEFESLLERAPSMKNLDAVRAELYDVQDAANL
jgi:hypothetical protein